MTLFARPSDAELLRIAADRLMQRGGAPAIAPPDTAPTLVVEPRLYPRDFGEPWAFYVSRPYEHVLELNLPVAPRTKKNHGRGVGKESAGYVRYRNQLADLIESCRAVIGLPMPELRYNCAARFYVDNDRADTHGLMQGLADALQDARVITNDRQLWAWDRTCQMLDVLHPRIEVRLEPYMGP